MLWPLACTDANASARVVFTRVTSVAMACVAPTAKFALPRCTVEPSLNSTACHEISGMSSGDPAMPRSNVIVVELVSCARSVRAPKSGPAPAVRAPASTNVCPTSTAVPRVAVVDSVAPVIVATVPRCTLMSAAFVNSTTCHQTTWPLPSLVLNCRLDVLVRSPAMMSSAPFSSSVGFGVIDQSTNAWFMAATGVIATSTVSADMVAVPRWTVTPEPNVATYH